MEPSVITLVVLINVVFLGVLIWKAAWLMRKIRGYPTHTDGSEHSAEGTAGHSPDSVTGDNDRADDGLRGERHADKQADEQQ